MTHTILLKAIPASEQRYFTQGDWFFDKDGSLTIAVTGIDIYDDEAFLIALHELVEVMLCKKRGITQHEVDEFDINFEEERALGLRTQDAEPGDDQHAPYRKEHRFACIVEHAVAHELGVTGYGIVA